MEYITDESDTRCILGDISFMELNDEEKNQLLAAMYDYIGVQVTFVQMGKGGKDLSPFNAAPCCKYFETDQVELRDTRCGRFGLPLKFGKETIPVYCHQDECNNMCLSLNVTKEPLSAFLTIEKCSPWAITIFRPFPYQLSCPIGYYRSEYSIVTANAPYACFSIQMFPAPISIQNVENENVVERYCTNGSIMKLTTQDEMFMFMQLSEQKQLSDGNHCLFGLTTDAIIEYADWDSVDIPSVHANNFKWNATMNYERMLSGDSYLAINPNGEWTWATDSVSCIVCMADVSIETPQLQLEYSMLEQKLKLSVTHQDFLFKEKNSDPGFICFALIGETYKTNLKILPVVGSVGTYFVESVGFGQYWCYGHTVELRTTEFRSSQKLTAYGMVFSFRIERKCIIKCSYNAKDLDRFVNVFEENYKFVKILGSVLVGSETSDFDREYTFIAHLSLALQNSAIDDFDTNLVNLTNRQLEIVYIYEQLNRMRMYNSSNEINILSVKSTEYCLHESTLSLEAIVWRVACIGETVMPSSLCPLHELTRCCLGDAVYGTYWKESMDASYCYSIVSETLLKLYASFNDSNQVSEDLKTILQENVVDLLPLDVFLTSRIVQQISNVTLDSLGHITSIYNSLMMVDESYLQMSTSLNSTNILLEAFDDILLSHFNTHFADGNVSIRSPLIETFVLDPSSSGVSGIALYRPVNAGVDDNFANYSLRYFYPNETVDDLFFDWDADKVLVVGSYLPAYMLKALNNITIAINVFFTDILFQSSHQLSMQPSTTHFDTNGKIISISIFELDDDARLSSKIPIFFETNRLDDSACGYWSLTSDIWSTNGCYLKRFDNFPHLAVCECIHLTHFGYLVNNGKIDARNEHILTVITVIGASLSLFGTFGIFITAAMFQAWRKKLSSKILIHFSASIALEMCLIIVTNADFIAYTSAPCIVMGSMVHYSVLTMFFWMFIIAYFQFRRYVVVFNFTVKHLLLKSAIFGWGAPLIPVITVLIIDHSMYLPVNSDELGFCYPTGLALNFGVLAPIGFIFSVNCIVYLSVLISLYRGLSISSSMSETAKMRVRLSQIRLYAFLFFSLGLTWIFGFLSRVHPACHLMFTYLFCLTSTIQGLVLFFYFIVVDPYVRSLWLKYFRITIGRE